MPDDDRGESGPGRPDDAATPYTAEPATSRAPRRRALWTGLSLTAALVVVIGAAWILRPGEVEASAPTPTPTITPTANPSPTPTPTHTPTPEPEVDPATLPQVDVFSVNPALPVDDDPFGSFTGEVARPAGAFAPVFAEPGGAPVAALPRDYFYDGTTVPIVERRGEWLKVLLTGRQSVPSQGNPAQTAGWLRAQDVDRQPVDARVEVSISARTVDIVHGGAVERVASDFAWGTPNTPTPLGRAFVMMIRTAPDLWYTRGHPLIYLSVQSPTLDGFAGASVAVTAFHYHDDRWGQISNGCIRLDPDAIAKLATLPLGTPVYIRA